MHLEFANPYRVEVWGYTNQVRLRGLNSVLASTIGAILATFHRATLNRQDYREFFSQEREGVPVNGGIPHIIRKLDRISPDVFGQVPADGLKSFALYQRYGGFTRASTSTKSGEQHLSGSRFGVLRAIARK